MSSPAPMVLTALALFIAAPATGGDKGKGPKRPTTLPRLSRGESVKRIGAVPVRTAAAVTVAEEVPAVVSPPRLKLPPRAAFSSIEVCRSYLAGVEGLPSDELRAEALVAFLRQAPITVESGAEVLRLVHRLRSDEWKLEVLRMMHEIVEADLVRGPLAVAYLEVARGLRSTEALTTALKQQLHPTVVPASVIVRALALAERIGGDDGKKGVLEEVLEHQRVDALVEPAFRKTASKLQDDGLQAQLLQALVRAREKVREECRTGTRRALVKEPVGDGYAIQLVSTEGDKSCEAEAVEVALAEEPEAVAEEESVAPGAQVIAPRPPEPEPAFTVAGQPRMNLRAEIQRLKREKARVRAESSELDRQVFALKSQVDAELARMRRDLQELEDDAAHAEGGAP